MATALSNTKLRSAEQVFQEYLIPNESIVWHGQPDPNTHFTTQDIFLIPFSLFWCGFAIFWEYTVLNGTKEGPGLIFPIFGIPFVIIGLYFVIGRFLYKFWKKKRTYYAVTNRRVLSVYLGRGRNFMAADIQMLRNIGISVRSNGIGTLKLEEPSYSPFTMGYMLYTNTGLDIFGFGQPGLRFHDIHNAAEVFKTIQQIQASQTR